MRVPSNAENASRCGPLVEQIAGRRVAHLNFPASVAGNRQPGTVRTNDQNMWPQTEGASEFFSPVADSMNSQRAIGLTQEQLVTIRAERESFVGDVECRSVESRSDPRERCRSLRR